MPALHVPSSFSKFEIVVPIDIPPQASPRYREEYLVQINSKAAPFCSGQWWIFAQWKGYTAEDHETRFGLRFEDVEDRIPLITESSVILEDRNGKMIQEFGLLEEEAFPCMPKGDLYLCDDFDLRKDLTLAQVRIVLQFDSGTVQCYCRSRRTRRFDGGSTLIFWLDPPSILELTGADLSPA